MKTYTDLITIDNFNDRLEYLMVLDNNALSPRHMSMNFYKSNSWLTIRDLVIERDMGFDLGMFGVYIDGNVYVHHINPIEESDIVYGTKRLLDMDNLITVSHKTHNIIHYGHPKEEDKWVERTPGDTILW